MYFLPLFLLFKLHQLAINARRKNRTWSHLAWSLLAVLSATILIGITALFVYALFVIKLWWMALIVLGIVMIPLTGSGIIRHVLVPLGAYRAAYYTGLVTRIGPDPTSYALCAAAWALGHRHTGAGEDWIARRRDVRMPLGDAEVITTALLASARGDVDTARLLMRSVLMLVEDHPPVRELAGEWLAVDAAERGAWHELADDAAEARWPASPMTFFLEGFAGRRVGAENAPGPFELWMRWVFAPHRFATRALLREARAAATTAATAHQDASVDTVDASTPPEHAALPRAIATHLAFGTSPPTETALGAAVHAWDAALTDAATQTWITRRALELDAPPGAVDRALRELAASVTDELVHIAEGAKLGAPASHGPIGAGIARRLRHGRLDSLEAGFTRWAQRRHDGEHHASIDEWREFVALQSAYAAAVTAGGLELRRLAFPHAYTTGSNMAAWLWNTRKEYALSHAISRWLLDEALVVGDAEAIELGHRNCGLDVPTRNNEG